MSTHTITLADVGRVLTLPDAAKVANDAGNYGFADAPVTPTLVVPTVSTARASGGLLSAYAKETVIISRPTFDQWDQPTGTPAQIIAYGRWEEKSRLVRNQSGEEVVSGAQFLTVAEVLYTDTVIRNGVEYKPIAKSAPKALSGGYNVVYFS